ncbi:MAG: glycosyltransferase family 2 protein [Streptosporangiaceae bacterium]
MSRVDVVIPCYNYGRFLSECVRSALDDQPGVDVRVLIIDDASPDGSAETALKLAAADGRIEVRAHPVNAGHIATYNEGLLGWADGDYCVLISADDRLAPGALRRAADLMDAHPEVGFVYGHAVEFRDGEEPPPAQASGRSQTIWPGHWWLGRRFREAQTCIFSPEVVVRTSLQHQVGGYDPELYHTGDAEMWMRLAAYADVGYVRADQAFYRRHGGNMSGVLGDDLLRLSQIRSAYEAVLLRCADVLPDAAELSQTVHRQLAKDALRIAARAYDRRRTDRVAVAELTAFAFDCWPGAASLSTYRSLQLRRRIGPAVMPYLQPLIWSAVVRHLQDRWRWHRRELHGI